MVMEEITFELNGNKYIIKNGTIEHLENIPDVILDKTDDLVFTLNDKNYHMGDNIIYEIEYK